MMAHRSGESSSSLGLVIGHNRSAYGQNLEFMDDILSPRMKVVMSFNNSFCSRRRDSLWNLKPFLYSDLDLKN